MSSRYQELLRSPVKVKRADNQKLKESDLIILTVVSCMCDNVDYVKIIRKKDDVETAKVSHYNNHCALSLNNLQLKGNPRDDLEWAMVDNDLTEIVRILNTGTSRVESFRMR